MSVSRLQITLEVLGPPVPDLWVAQGVHVKRVPGVYLSVALDGASHLRVQVDPERAEAFVLMGLGEMISERSIEQVLDGDLTPEKLEGWWKGAVALLREAVQRELSDAVDTLAERKAHFDRLAT